MSSARASSRSDQSRLSQRNRSKNPADQTRAANLQRHVRVHNISRRALHLFRHGKTQRNCRAEVSSRDVHFHSEIAKLGSTSAATSAVHEAGIGAAGHATQHHRNQEARGVEEPRPRPILPRPQKRHEHCQERSHAEQRPSNGFAMWSGISERNSISCAWKYDRDYDRIHEQTNRSNLRAALRTWRTAGHHCIRRGRDIGCNAGRKSERHSRSLSRRLGRGQRPACRDLHNVFRERTRNTWEKRA